MEMELKDLIIQLAQQPGPSGFETLASRTAAELLAPLVDGVRTDVMGNVIGVRRARRDNAPVVMLDAHMDEVGLIVTGYEKGALRFHPLGGVDPRILPALEVALHTKEGELHGVIDVLPPHVVPLADREKPLAMDKLFIDAGFDSEEEAKKHVPLGTHVTFITPCFAMGENSLCGKSLDDRSCAAILLAVMDTLKDEPLDADVAVNLASQEEVGGRGAVTAAFGIEPDYAVALDVTFAETPDSPKEKCVKMNGGAAIGVGAAVSRSVSEKLESVAAEKNIPYQLEVLPSYSGTDADDIQISRTGVATGVVSLPLKYMHTPMEVIDLRDAKAVADLLAAWLRSFGEEM